MLRVFYVTSGDGGRRTLPERPRRVSGSKAGSVAFSEKAGSVVTVFSARTAPEAWKASPERVNRCDTRNERDAQPCLNYLNIISLVAPPLCQSARRPLPFCCAPATVFVSGNLLQPHFALTVPAFSRSVTRVSPALTAFLACVRQSGTAFDPRP